MTVNRDSDDPIIFFTLIDFLVQLLFFALLIFTVHNFKSQAIQNTTVLVPGSPDVYAILIDGLSPYVRAEKSEQLKELLQKMWEKGLLEDFVRFVNRVEDPLSVMKTCAANPNVCESVLKKCAGNTDFCERLAGADEPSIKRMLGALGNPPCEAAGARSLFTIIARDGPPGRDGFYEISSTTPLGRARLAAAGIVVANGELLSKAQFTERFKLLHPKQLKCAHFVSYVKQSDSESLRFEVEKTFTPIIAR